MTKNLPVLPEDQFSDNLAFLTAECEQLKKDLQMSQANFAAILNIAYEAIISIDSSQKITLFNKGAEQIFGYNAGEVLGRSLDILLPKPFTDVHRRYLLDFAHSTTTTRLMGERREIAGRRKNGIIFPAEASISKLGGSQDILTVVLRDISERKQTEAEREALINQLGALNDAARVIAAELSPTQVLQEIAKSAQKLMKVNYVALGIYEDGIPVSPLITSGHDLDIYAEIRSWPTKYDLLEPLLNRGKTIVINTISQHLSSTVERYLPIQRLLGVPIVSKGQMIGVLYLADKENNANFSIADRELMEKFTLHAAIAIENARLYEQTQRLAVLEERERFARDLHDGIIQSIYAVGLTLDQAKADILPVNQQAGKQIEMSLKSLAGVIQDIRNYIFDLQPQAAQHKNLGTRLEYLFKEIKTNTHLSIQSHLDPAVNTALTSRQADHIFHICHELLSNTVRHAKPSRISVSLTRQGQTITLKVEDDGIGFTPPAEVAPGHHGLANVYNRATQLGASVHINSAPGQGTAINLRLKCE